MPVPAGFIGKLVELIALNFQDDLVIAAIGGTGADRPVLSAFAGEKPFVGPRHIGGEQFGVGAALGGMDFEKSDHGVSSEDAMACSIAIRASSTEA